MGKKSKRDKENDTINLPAMKDIPGQENIRPPRIREMEDSTVASDGEEGKGLPDYLNSEDSDDNLLSGEDNVSEQEAGLLAATDRPLNDESRDLKKLSLDNSDGEEPLNENGNPADFGEGLDIPGADLDDDEEETGSEDEENNYYSRPD